MRIFAHLERKGGPVLMALTERQELPEIRENKEFRELSPNKITALETTADNVLPAHKDLKAIPASLDLKGIPESKEMRESPADQAALELPDPRERLECPENSARKERRAPLERTESVERRGQWDRLDSRGSSGRKASPATAASPDILETAERRENKDPRGNKAHPATRAESEIMEELESPERTAAIVSAHPRRRKKRQWRHLPRPKRNTSTTSRRKCRMAVMASTNKPFITEFLGGVIYF